MSLTEKIKRVGASSIGFEDVSFSQINIELGRDWDAPINLNEPEVRNLASDGPSDPVLIPESYIRFSDFRGKAGFVVLNIDSGQNINLKKEVNKIRYGFDGEVILFVNGPVSGDTNSTKASIDMIGPYSHIVLYNDGRIHNKNGPAINWRGKNHTIVRKGKIYSEKEEDQVQNHNVRDYNG